ncbi:phosphorylated adapter RNA export protein [Klebsormidium nitens]|uniref:Phosphorylated adapter RNA export protein n=1 Tax=Klebsormidium nitens TaxID=105231 RepID=A0A1Y1IEU2_KLENI|nr:phosphorylated adapter RNA export protein [Klebsormidium nitens]|eukprot:GAQ87601.1 phosphorylated adapter RNA export protein [Klebsormidium nitens]
MDGLGPLEELDDEELVDYGSECEGDEPEAQLGEDGVAMELEPSPVRPGGEETAGSFTRNAFEEGKVEGSTAQLQEDDLAGSSGKPTVDLREVIEHAKKYPKQRGAGPQDLDQMVEEARGGKAENKGRKRQRAEKLDPAMFIKAASTRLQEPKLGLLWRALKILGVEPMQQLMVEVEAIERAGGQLIADGSRRRSPGGVFWNVVKQRVKPEVYTSIFAEEQAKSKQRKRGKPSKKRKKQEAGAVLLEGIVDQPEAPLVDFKSLVTPDLGGLEEAEN